MALAPAPVLALAALAPLTAVQSLPSRVELRGNEALASAGARSGGLARDAVGTLLEAEDAARARDWEAAESLLEGLWKRHPVGDAAWSSAAAELGGANFGSPPGYYALRMLTDCVRWRRAEAALPVEERPRARPFTLSVVLVGRSEGVEPRSLADLEAGRGTRVTHELEPRLRERDHAVIRGSLALFGEYLTAATDGRLALEPRFLDLRESSVAVEARAKPHRAAGLASGELESIWAELADDARRESDGWWVIYPSHVPERHPDFARTEFITGGMAGGPNGGPCFLIDDRWLVRRPPHLGQGPYTEEERRAYLPQWLQHELFHHLFGSYPELGLEAESHQWFDRARWPADFVGRFECDYYQEALHKRLRAADPPLHLRLSRAGAPAALLAELDAAALEGEYVREPVENDWHRVELRRSSGSRFTWRNAAGVQWKLELDAAAGTLRAGPDNPYHDPSSPRRNDVAIELARDAEGKWTPAVRALRIGGETYRRRERR